MKILDGTKDPLSLLQEQIHEQFAGFSSSEVYEPTGVQEEMIVGFGCGRYSIVLCLHDNKCGKTATAANILKNVFWPNQDRDFFHGQLYTKWPYQSKQGRVIGTVKNTADDGPIRKEILKWWPRSRFASEKLGKKYESHYVTDSGFEFDVMTYEQDPDEFEGPFLSWTWCDEPPPEKLVGAITSRFIGGGIWLITATPINCGPFLAVINDLKDRGKKVLSLTATLYDSSVTKGKPNHKGRKKGLWTDDQITDYVAGIPPDEVDARVFGKANAKSGMVFPMFNKDVHVIGSPMCPYPEFDLGSSYARAANCFCVMDPHRKGYPAIQWWMLLPNDDLICYNEWPTYDMMKSYYDEIRKTLICNLTPEQISKYINILDGTSFGLRVRQRWMDPRFGKGTEGEFGRRTESLMTDYAKYVDPPFELPPAEKIDVKRDMIRDLLRYKESLPVNQYNKPKIFWMPHCKNSIRCIERHYWDEENEKESERYKEFGSDLPRYLLAGLGQAKWVDLAPKKRTKSKLDDPIEELIHSTELA